MIDACVLRGSEYSKMKKDFVVGEEAVDECRYLV